jgi:ATP-dependent Zn protease
VQAARTDLVREAYADVKARLTALKPALQQAAQELLEQRELTGERIKEILREHAGSSSGSDGNSAE